MHAGINNAAAFAADCDGILEAFLHDMSALDQQQLRPLTELKLPALPPKKREFTDIVQAPTTKKKRLNPSWLKRKRELQALREETQALETRMAFLKMKQEDAAALTAAASTETLEQQRTQKAAFEVEKKRCNAAQEENESLKGQLQAYVNLTGTLQSALTSVQQQQNSLLSMSMATVRALRIEDSAGYQLRLASPSVFDMLERRVDERFRELESSFRETQPPRMTIADTELVQVYCKSDDPRADAVEFKRAQLLPFEESALSAKILSIVELGGFPDGQDSRVIRRSDDTYAMDSLLTVCLENGEGSLTLNGHSVMKRFVTMSGTVLLLESSSDWTADFNDSSSWVHTTQEVGCFVICNYASNGSRGPSEISQLRTRMMLKPGAPSTQTSRYPLAKARTFNDVVIPSFREIIKSRHQFVENAIFDCIRGGFPRT